MTEPVDPTKITTTDPENPEPRQISAADVEKIIVPATKDLISVTNALRNNPEFMSLLKQYVKITPTWRQHWTSIAHHIGALVNICMIVTLLPEGVLPAADVAWIALGVQLVAVLAGMLVPTEISTAQAKALEAYQGKHRAQP